MSDLFQTSSAILSDCGQYRYRLDRVWDPDKKTVVFLMLNPSTADGNSDDPTIRRCISFAKAWGFGGLTVGNLFALRATNPKELYAHPDPVGPDNDDHLLKIAQSSMQVICAWGTHGALRGRASEVYSRLEFFDLRALKVTAKGHPGHPLYIAASTERKPFVMKDIDHG